MSRMKWIMLSLVAVLGVSAVASVTASAATKNRFFVEKVELAGSDKIEGTVETAQLNSIVANLKMMIVCTENKLVANTGEIEALGASKGEIEYNKCKVYEIKEGVLTLLTVCTVKEPIKFSFKDQLIEGPGGLVEDEFKPSSGTVFVKIEITGSLCAFKGTLEPKGTYVASLGDEGERQLVEHELVFTSTGSKITLGTEKGAFTNRVSKVKVVGSKPWYVE